MPKTHLITLNCCGSKQEVIFDGKGSPATAPQEIRENTVCQKCEKLVILSLKLKGNIETIDQEVINLG